MENILNELQELSDHYKHLAEVLGLPDDCIDVYFSDCDEAIEEGKRQTYCKTHIDLERIIKKHDKRTEN
jgi:hypothetical protein